MYKLQTNETVKRGSQKNNKTSLDLLHSEDSKEHSFFFPFYLHSSSPSFLLFSFQQIIPEVFTSNFMGGATLNAGLHRKQTKLCVTSLSFTGERCINPESQSSGLRAIGMLNCWAMPALTEDLGKTSHRW